MTYLVEYAASDRSSCHTVDCLETGIALGQLRIGKGSRQTLWFHVDCFFKYLAEVGPKTIKLKSWEDFVRRRGDPNEEDQQLLNEKIAQCVQEKTTKKRKARKDINDRFAKIAKLDLPPLLTDNLNELLRWLKTKDLLTVACVNKQFLAISRKLLVNRAVHITHKSFHDTTESQLPFVIQLKKLTFELKHFPSELQDEKYTQLLAQLTNLQSIKFCDHLKFGFPALERLTQLTEIDLSWKFGYPRLDSQTSALPRFDELKALQKLSLQDYYDDTPIANELLPLFSQLKHLSLNRTHIDSVRNFTNLESLSMNNCYKGVPTKLIEEAFVLPRLTSLETNMLCDFTKWTRLKALKFTGVFVTYTDRTFKPLLQLPPNLEQLITTETTDIQEVLPTTLKYLNVGPIVNHTIYNSVRALSDQCVIELHYHGFKEIPADILQRNNVTIVVAMINYGKYGWDQMTSFFAGTPPRRLRVKLYNWKKCQYKPKLLDALKSAESRMAVMVDLVTY